MEARRILDRTWVAVCEPKRRRNELNDYSAAARRLFRKDRAFRSWMEEVRAPRQHALDAFDEFNAKRGPWQRLLRERRENRMVVVTTEAEASRAPEGRHQAGDLGDWGSAAALLYKNKVYRKWRAESPPDEATWEIFTEKRGPWDRRCRARRDRRRAQGGRDAREWRRRMLPCERAAIDSSRAATRGARSRQVLLDRVPARAAADPLTPSLATFETFTRTVQPREENDHMHGGTTRRRRRARWPTFSRASAQRSRRWTSTTMKTKTTTRSVMKTVSSTVRPRKAGATKRSRTARKARACEARVRPREAARRRRDASRRHKCDGVWTERTRVRGWDTSRR